MIVPSNVTLYIPVCRYQGIDPQIKIQQDATMYQIFIIPYLYEAQHV
jgi:hypothetical protein